jgi:hypothetical protein
VLFTIFLFFVNGLLYIIAPAFHERLDTYIEAELGMTETMLVDNSFMYLEYVSKTFEFILISLFDITIKDQYVILDAI